MTRRSSSPDEDPVPTIHVFLRFDDYCATSPIAIEQGLVAALRRTGLSATFAVVPALTEGSYHEPGDRGTVAMSEAKRAFLREAVTDGVVDAALHGWNHRTRVAAPPHSEFEGLDPSVQHDLIGRGAAVLREWTGRAPSVFVPPWNRYDQATLAALEVHGFRCLSAHRFGAVGGRGLRFAPITIEIPNLRRAVAHARTEGDADPIVGVLMHPYDFHESGDPRATMSLASFERDLEWLAAQADVRVVTIARLTDANTSLDAARYRANRPHGFETVAPPFVVRTGAVPYYASRRQAARSNLWRGAQTLVTHLAGLAGGAAAGAAGGLPELPGAVLWAPAMALMLATLPGRALRRPQADLRPSLMRREVYFRTSFAAAVLTGVVLATTANR